MMAFYCCYSDYRFVEPAFWNRHLYSEHCNPPAQLMIIQQVSFQHRLIFRSVYLYGQTMPFEIFFLLLIDSYISFLI